MPSAPDKSDRSDAQAGAGAELWPREEARRLAERVASYDPSRPVIFESGFGPSGLPHLGTMCEIVRPAYVRRAFSDLERTRPTRLVVLSTTWTGSAKCPRTFLIAKLPPNTWGQPVSKIPDPFGECHASFAEHMVSLLGEYSWRRSKSSTS